MAKTKQKNSETIKKHDISTENNVNIQGNVKLSIKYGNKTLKSTIIKNSATKDLFYGLALILRQDPDSSAISTYLPKYLSVGDDPDVLETTFTKNKLKHELLKTGRRQPIYNYGGIEVDTTTKTVSTTFQGIITYNLVQNNTIKEIGLYGTNDGNNTLTNRIILTGTEESDPNYPITLDPGQSLVVDWVIVFKINNN